MKLGELIKVNDLRTVWSHEAYDFTNWLAEENNLQILSDEIGLNGIELIDTEVKTGSFFVDILANETDTNDKIIIENQLELTDHDHLGKIITYASGHDAKTIIWIVKEAKEEHRQAIDWLNEHTDSDINIFLCKIELWKINDSPLAPNFQVICKPNNWTKSVKIESNITPSKKIELNYWNKVNEYINNNNFNFSTPAPRPRPIHVLAIGNSAAQIRLTFNTKNEMSVRFHINDDKELFDKLYENKNEIEKELGFELEWDRSDKYKSSQIRVFKDINYKNEGKWTNYIKWQVDTADKLVKVFLDKINNLN